MFRTIVEHSIMMNNDEFIHYTDKKMSQEDFSDKIVISRPVYEVEIKEGLSVEKSPISIYKENPPSITYFLDSLYKMKYNVVYWKTLKEAGLENVNLLEEIIKDISLQFYDCMSGGISGYSLALIKEICKVVENEVDMNMPLYPKDDKIDQWITLKDFLEEIKDTPDIESLWNKLRKELPDTNIKRFLLE